MAKGLSEHQGTEECTKGAEISLERIHMYIPSYAQGRHSSFMRFVCANDRGEAFPSGNGGRRPFREQLELGIARNPFPFRDFFAARVYRARAETFERNYGTTVECN